MSFLWGKNDLLLGDELRRISYDSATRRDLVLRNFYANVQDAVVKLLKDRASTSPKTKTNINIERLFIEKHTVDGVQYTPLGQVLKSQLKQADINFTVAELNSYGASLNTFLSGQHLVVTFVAATAVHLVRIGIDWTTTEKELVGKELVMNVETPKDAEESKEENIVPTPI